MWLWNLRVYAVVCRRHSPQPCVLSERASSNSFSLKSLRMQSASVINIGVANIVAHPVPVDFLSVIACDYQ